MITRADIELSGIAGSMREDAEEGVLRGKILNEYIIYVLEEDISLTPSIINYGYWEAWITSAMLNQVKPGWFCLDIGANVGYYTMLLAGAVGDTGKVIAFEPNPVLNKLVQRSIDENNLQNAQVFPTGISNEQRSGALYIPENYIGSAAIFPIEGYKNKKIDIDIVTLDSYNFSNVDFIKIDCEGEERNIWYGMQETINRSSDIQISLEWFPGNKGNDREFLQEIRDTGFNIYIMNFEGELQPEDDMTLFTPTLRMLWLSREKKNRI